MRDNGCEANVTAFKSPAQITVKRSLARERPVRTVLRKRGFIFLYALVILCLVYLIFDGALIDRVSSEPLYFYSVLLFTVAFILALLVVHKRRTVYLPSLILLLFFLVGPVIGASNYRHFIDKHGNFYGRGLISLAFPTFVWAVGTASFFAGVLISHLTVRWPKRNYVILWNFKALSFFLWFTLGLSLICSIIAVFRIGYIPVLARGILEERVKYVAIVGRYIMRFSLFWVFASALSSMTFFLKGHKKRYLCITFVCALGMLLYGQRTGSFFVVVCLGLMYVKFDKPKISRLVVVWAALFVLAYGLLFYARRIRQEWDFRGEPIRETLTVRWFVEWMHYATVVTETKESPRLSGKKLFLGPLSTLLPRQIFMLFGVDKLEIIQKYSAVYHYGREFDDPYGIRVTPTGEAYAGYGIVGVILLLFVLGLSFGGLESFYLGLNKRDARVCVVCFFLSTLMYLPLLSVYNILAEVYMPLLWFGLLLVMGTTRRNVLLKDARTLVAYESGIRTGRQPSAKTVHWQIHSTIER